MHDPTVLQWLAFLVVFFVAAGLLGLGGLWLLYWLEERAKPAPAAQPLRLVTDCAHRGHYYRHVGHSWQCTHCGDERPYSPARTFGGRS